MSDSRDPSGSPWQKLYHSRSDRAFITTMGFDTKTFDSILNAGFAPKWVKKSILRDDNLPVSIPQPGRRSLDSDGALGLVLHYFNSTMHEITLQQIFAFIPTTVSRYIEFGLDNLLEVLRKMPDAGIYRAHNEATCERYTDLITNHHPHLNGAVASINGLNLAAQTSKDIDIENATYNGWILSALS